MRSDKQRRIVRLALRVLQGELDYHGWREFSEVHRRDVEGIDENDIRQFIEKVQARPQ